MLPSKSLGNRTGQRFRKGPEARSLWGRNSLQGNCDMSPSPRMLHIYQPRTENIPFGKFDLDMFRRDKARGLFSKAHESLSARGPI